MTRNIVEKTGTFNHTCDRHCLILASLIPLAAFALQWYFWEVIQPYAWILFYPAVFFSSWIGGKRAGLAATALSTILVWWFFIPTRYSFVLERPASLLSIGIFSGMGILFSLTHERLRKASRQAAEALDAVNADKGHQEEWVSERTADLVRIVDELRYSEARFRMMVECVKDYSIIMLDVDGHVVNWNAGAERIKGYQADEIVGQHFSRFYPREELESGKPDKGLLVAAAEGRYEDEGWRVRKDGSLFMANVVITPLRDNKGLLRGFAKITRDITERKQGEEAIRRLNEELEERVRERTAQLETLNKELDAFSYSVSHDLKAPLRGIDGYSQLLEKDYSDRLDDEGRLFIRNVRASAARMHELIDDLLSYSRMERRALLSVPLDLPALVQAVVAERAAEIGQAGLLLRLEIPTLAVRADRDGLAVVLRNLLENAIKFSRNAQPPTVEIGARAQGEKLLLWVRDNGIGFDMKFHDRIFDIFQRLQRAEEYPGTGIGLALVRKAMLRMGGRVWAESAPGQGATFFLEITI